MLIQWAGAEVYQDYRRTILLAHWWKLPWSRLGRDEVEQLAAKVQQIDHSLTGTHEPAGNSVSGFCHDIRNPLTVIREFASIVADGLGGPVTQQQREYLETIIKAVNKANGMVDELFQQHAGRPPAAK